MIQSWEEGTWGTSGFADFFGAKITSPSSMYSQQGGGVVSQLWHGCVTILSCPPGCVTVVSQLWQCQTSHDNEISSLEHLLCDTLWHDIMWHTTVTQMSHTIAQKCHTYDEPVTLEILVDIDTCRFRWFSIRLVFGSIRSIGQLVAGQED